MDWLERSQARYETVEVTPVFHGAIRGAGAIDLTKLHRAICLVKEAVAPGCWYVYDPETQHAMADAHGDALQAVRIDPTDGLPTWEWSEGQFVNLRDPQVERCYCEDYLYRDDTGKWTPGPKGPCKHILAAMLAEEDTQLLPYVEELARQQRLARGLTR